MNYIFGLQAVEPASTETAPMAKMPNGVPVRVAVAMNFVALCNDNMGIRSWENEYGGTRVKYLDLHHKQDAAFGMACNLLGDYFAGKEL
jgi:hypothetical protein